MRKRRKMKKAGCSGVAHTFNPNTQEVEPEAEAGRSLGLRPAWSIQIITSELGIHNENMSYKKKSFGSRNISLEEC